MQSRRRPSDPSLSRPMRPKSTCSSLPGSPSATRTVVRGWRPNSNSAVQKRCSVR